MTVAMINTPQIMFLSPFGDIHLGRQLTYKKDGHEVKDKYIPDNNGYKTTNENDINDTDINSQKLNPLFI